MNITASTLLMFSGGLDSTGAFWKLLTDGCDVHVHHMKLKNIENRMAAEEKAVSNIYAYVERKYSFTHSESLHEYSCFNNNFIGDSEIASFMAGHICISSPSIKHVAFGRTATDGNMERRLIKPNKIFSSFDPQAYKIYPVIHLTKQEVYDSLPKELSALTWSCRTPVYNGRNIEKCGKCHACYHLKNIYM